MKRVSFLLYALMIIMNLLPFIPLSMKGILGLVFIVISSIKLSFRDGMATASLLIVLEFTEFILGINADYKLGIITMLLGSVLYLVTAYCLGSFAETFKKRNRELSNEIERRKKVEKELKEKITMLQSLMDTIPSPIFFKDLSFKYLGCNRAFENAIGISSSELSGRSAYDISDFELADVYHKMDEELLKDPGIQSYEEVVRFPDGSFRNVIFNKAIYSDEDGSPIGIVGVMTDITDKKEAVKLKQSIVEDKQIISEILENDKMKTEFFSNISHELRTPINVILGSVQLMELYLKNNDTNNLKEKITRNIGAMKQNCYRLIRLVNNFIDITKIDASAFEMHLRKCNIVSVIEEISQSVSNYVGNKGINLIFDTDIEEKTMACDDEKIERIMLNLLSNAVKFTPEGGNIFVNVYDKDNGLLIKVEDDGVGIPEDKQDLIFKRFCQIDKMFTREHEGSGIGLSLVKALVEMHGGTITFKSRAGKGTCFSVFLPSIIVEEEEKRYNTITKQTNIERINIEFSDIYSIAS